MANLFHLLTKLPARVVKETSEVRAIPDANPNVKTEERSIVPDANPNVTTEE